MCYNRWGKGDTMELSARLQTVATLVPPQLKIADIGTDHAYLPVYLVQKGIALSAIASDNKVGPCQAALKTIAEQHLLEKINVRLGEGLATLKPQEVDAIIIAGMGGLTILSILNAHPEILTAGLKAIIVQPQTDAELVRQWAEKNKWGIVAEELAEEGDKLYEMFRLEPDPNYIYPGKSYEVGSLLISEQHPLLKKKLTKLLEMYSTCLQGMAQSSSAAQAPKYQAIKNKLAKIKEIYDENYSR